MYEKTTHNISVIAEPAYLADQSSPEDSKYVWAYKITIRNNSLDTVQLRSRYWRITNAAGAVQEVSGDGVVGEQPIIRPGDTYEYTSGAPLDTPGGFMSGTYTMEKNGGQRFIIDIPPFSLDSPYQHKAIH